MLKGGVFGFGGVGQGMTRRINGNEELSREFRIVAAANRGEEKRKLAREKFGLAAYRTADELLEHGIDFMLIVSTSHAHKDAAMKCVEAGVPYLIEKPITLTVEDGVELVEATERAGLINAVNYTMRYEAVYRRMKEMVDGGEIGTLLSLWASVGRGYGFYAAGKRHRAVVEPEESGGWIIHHMCHIIDFASWIGGKVERVYGVAASTLPAERRSEEVIHAVLRFAGGAVGQLSDQVGILREHRAGVAGTKGALMEHYTAVSSRNVKPLLVFKKETDHMYHAPRIVDPAEGDAGGDGLAHFLSCLKEGRQTDVTVRDALYSLKVAHAIRRSVYTGRPVEVEE